MTTRNTILSVAGLLVIILGLMFFWTRMWESSSSLPSDVPQLLTIDYANGEQESFILSTEHSYSYWFDDGDRFLGSAAAPSLRIYAVVDGETVFYRILFGPGDRYSVTTISSDEEIEP